MHFLEFFKCRAESHLWAADSCFRWSNRQNKADFLLRFIEECSVLQLSQTLNLTCVFIAPAYWRDHRDAHGNKWTGVTDLLHSGILKHNVNCAGMVLHESRWPGGHSRQHQDFPVPWHHLRVFHCLPAVSAAGMKSCVLSPTDVWVSSFKVGADWSPRRCSSHVYTSRSIMDARCPNLRHGAAEQAKCTDVFCVQAVDQKSGGAHNHLQALCWDRLCARCTQRRGRGQQETFKRTTQEQSVQQFYIMYEV